MKTGIFLSEGLDTMLSDLPVRQNQFVVAGLAAGTAAPQRTAIAADKPCQFKTHRGLKLDLV